MKATNQFIARGLASSRKAKQTGRYVVAEELLEKLRGHLSAARKKLSRSAHPGK